MLRRGWAGVVVLAVVMTVVPGQPVAANPPVAAGQPTSSPLERATHAVTLVTGDRVLVGHDGKAVRPSAGRGREHIRFTLRRMGDHVYVVPSDAVPMLTAGRLDWRLFDVTNLVEIGYDDARRKDLPLIVRTGGAAANGAAAGVTVTRRLSTLDVSAVRVTKDTAFWGAVRSDRAARIWLDGVRRPVLDRSVPHIGAPAAWQAGYTGAGVTVAVLDTGIDATHPDLVGRVAEARNFTEDPDPADLVGHGTHVASTIVGTGVASDGRYRGVAHGATLLDGKVCEFFFCSESAILAGMEWAAAEKHAPVVNVSLGGADFPGLDPLEEAVNRLTAAHGTLFVIAAGNVPGCSQGNRVGSPGSAVAALTVGATDLADRLAGFSCQGPTVGDGAIKPDLTAPGVDIVAARVAGTPVGDSDPVGEHYTRISGTSMATPHVAGAAAILAQRHPDWRAGQLKATLMGSAAANPALTAYQQGAGRVDVARAITQSVSTAPASVSLGVQRWPHTDDEPVTRTLTYHNAGPAAVALAVRVDVTGPDGRHAPTGMFAASATTVTVPAGGEASLTLTADTRVAGPDGFYSGRIVASAGDIRVGTPFAIDREVESYDLTVRAVDRGGAPTSAFLGDVFAPAEPVFVDDGDGDGIGIVRLPRGEYDLAAFVFEPGEPEPGEPSPVTLLGAHVPLNRDTSLTLDARTARPVEVVPPRDSARMPIGAVAAVGSQPGYSFSFGVIARDRYQNIFTGHIGPASDRERFSSYVHGGWLEPGPAGDFLDSPYTYHLTWFSPGRMFDGLVRRPRDRDLAIVRSEHPAPPARAGEKIDFARLPGVLTSGTIGVVHQFALPATRTEYYTTEGVEWWTELLRSRLDPEPSGEALHGATWRAYRKGSHHERWGVGVLGPAFPTPYFPEVWVRQFPQTLVFAPPMYSDATPGHYGYVRTDTARTTMYRNGTQVAQSDRVGFVLYEAPAEVADFRVETTATQSIYDTVTETRAVWRFRSRPPVGGEDSALQPVMAVRFLPQLDSHNRAPGGRPYLLPISVERQPGATHARVVSLTVDVSYNDGRSWQRVRLVKAGDRWLAPVRHPASGFVSLRAKAIDTDGNSVEQTIIRGYGLR